ncbi:MAG: serine/threonine-protein kinase [Prochloraceae cyanobacterium]|nr:serine/threonine-protein kinase [Prochloraceae cyanobacterium]
MFKKRILASRYQLLKILGKGAFGTTYLAKDILLPNTPLCVVKKLNPVVKDDDSLTIARRLFSTEAESLQKLGEHPQIPRFLGFFEENEQFYLAQQYIEGHSLSEELSSSKIWSELEIIELLYDCLNILKFIHAQNVIHRDIKPDNLIRNKENNRLVLVDFGAVKEAISQSQIIPTIAIGTQGYMPSEQAMGKPRFNSDIYAVGIIAIQALTGLEVSSFGEDKKGNILWYGREDINPKLTKILNKMTRYHFKERYTSAADILKDLERLDSDEISIADNLLSGFDSLLSRFKKEPATSIETNLKPNNILPKTELPTTLHQRETVNTTIFVPPGKSNNLFKNFKLKSPLGIGLGASLLMLGGGAQLQFHQQQQRIANVLNLMGENYERKEYDLCLNNARIEASKVGVSESKIQEFIGKCTLGTAKQEGKNENYSKAIALATGIPKNNPFAPQARENIDKWSKIQLDRATEIYQREGQLDKINPLIASIPKSSPVKNDALELRDKWQSEITSNEAILANAERSMTAKKWLDATNEANKVKTATNSIYWREKADKIITEAEKNRQEEIAAAARQRAAQNRRTRRYSNYSRPASSRVSRPKQRTTTRYKYRSPKRSTTRYEYRRRVGGQRIIIRRETRVIRRTR